MMNKKLIALFIALATVVSISADGLFQGVVDVAEDTTNAGVGVVTDAVGEEGPVERVERGRENREARREDRRARREDRRMQRQDRRDYRRGDY